MNDGGVCRKAPATPGLLNKLKKIEEMMLLPKEIELRFFSEEEDKMLSQEED